MSIESFKHKKDKRAYIPSQEEAGYEADSPTVQNKSKAEFPKNPVVHRGQDPELFWLKKYEQDDREETLEVDIRSLYRAEHISPEMLIDKLYRLKEIESPQLSLNDLFGNALDMDELDKVSEYYQHQDGWTNRLIQGDSLLVMTSLLEREGMAGKVQMIYIDPPYGIKYGSNWQVRMQDRTVKDGSDEHLSGEPEQIKAFRDTWELGIHSYLSYLRDRLIVAKELLTESGSCFVQISDENVHLVRNIMDEVFGSENFVSKIVLRTRSNSTAKYLSTLNDNIIFYAKNSDNLKYQQLYIDKEVDFERFNLVELDNGKIVNVNQLGMADKSLRPFTSDKLQSTSGTGKINQRFEYKGKFFIPVAGRGWRCSIEGLKKLAQKNRLLILGKSLRYKYYFDDFPATEISNLWVSQISEQNKDYIVQTAVKAVQRCLLMTTEPGDLVLDPTCGSGTTAYVAEQWGRRWITIDTSRIAINIAKTRLMTAVFPYYTLTDEKNKDIRQGFIYKKVPHVTLKSLANDEPPEEETLYDQAKEDKKRFRVAGPFTVETLQSDEPLLPEALAATEPTLDDATDFEQRIFEHLKSAGVKNGLKGEHAVFIRVERLNSDFLHAEGFYQSATGEKKAYFHIGPQFGIVSKPAVNETVKECRRRGDADWLIILGFSFESTINNQNITTRVGSFEVTKARMHDDLLQQGLLKKDKKAASFVTIGEPDIQLHKKGQTIQVEICGLDIYNPIKNIVEARNLHDIVYWMVDDDYDGSNFFAKQVFFCGGNKDEFKKWQKGLSNFAEQATRKRAQQTLKIEIDAEAFARVYGYRSHPITVKPSGHKIAVRIISQFGEESTKVLEIL